MTRHGEELLRVVHTPRPDIAQTGIALAGCASSTWTQSWKILSTSYGGRLTELPSVIHMIATVEFCRQAT